MDTKEVVAMIDAITEGRPYTLNLGEGVNFEFGPNGISLIADGIGVLARLTKGRPTREIAGALVAWANRKEGKLDTSNKALALVDTLVSSQVDYPSVNDWSNLTSGRITFEAWYKLHVPNMGPEAIEKNIKALEDMRREWAPSSVKFHDTGKALEILKKAMPEGSVWRATWYRRSVENMSQETKDRNLSDLTKIQAELHPNDIKQVDIAAAIQILVDNGARYAPTKEETKAAFKRGEIPFDPNALRGN